MNKLRFAFYKYKENTYVVLDIVELKDPQSGEWVPAVLYQKYDDKRSPKYVRYLEDFLRKFQGVKP